MAGALVYGAFAAPLFDPLLERVNRLRFFRDDIPDLALANSISVSSGRWPAGIWILLRRSDYNQISLYSTSLQLVIGDGFHPNLTFQNLAIVQARCVSRGSAADPNAIYLVQLTDGRGLAANRWFSQGALREFNIVAPAYPGLYYEESISSGIPYSWDTMLANLWLLVTAWVGAYPTLPATGTTPEGWAFPGVSAWGAINDILDHLGFAVAVDLTAGDPYTIVNLGVADGTLTGLQSTYAPLLLDDMEWIDVGAGRVPRQVIVYFHRRNQYYGTEETVRRDTLQWESTPVYTVIVFAPAQFLSAAGTQHLWSDFTVRYDVNGTPLAADVVTAALVAQQEVNRYFGRIYRSTAGFMRQTYAGALPFVTGSQVDGVRWRHNYAQNRSGWVTEITRGEDPAWPEVKAYGEVNE